jgi:hypothetical protein
MSPFAKLVQAELASAKDNHPPQNSAHEAYAVMLEEVEEFWDECRKKKKDRSPSNMLKELVQIAAMAQRAAEDLNLIPME